MSHGRGELELLEWIKPELAKDATGDDAAAIPDGDGFLVVSCDMFVEGKHFLQRTDGVLTGWRALALAVNDLAAKGAQPRWALTAIAIPKRPAVDREYLGRVYRGMGELARKLGIEIVGGDLSSIDGPWVLSITVAGHTRTAPIPRSAAKPGWAIGVTGALGGAAVALREDKPLRLVPLIEEGRRLNELGLSCGDVSDGLVREMEKFAAMSGAGSVLYADKVPRAPGASPEDALTSGEEAELVCVGPPRLVESAGLHVVGEMTEGRAVTVVGATLRSTGYDHFA